MNPTPVLHERARDGAPIVRVPLTNAEGAFATLDVADYDRLVAAGYRGLFLNTNSRGSSYVNTYARSAASCRDSVARLVTACPRDHVIRYADGDRLNLRRGNLLVAKGSAKGQKPNRTVSARAA